MKHIVSTLLAVLGITAVFAGFGSVAFAGGNGPDSGQVCASTTYGASHYQVQVCPVGTPTTTPPTTTTTPTPTPTTHTPTPTTHTPTPTTTTPTPTTSTPTTTTPTPTTPTPTTTTPTPTTPAPAVTPTTTPPTPVATTGNNGGNNNGGNGPEVLGEQASNNNAPQNQQVQGNQNVAGTTSAGQTLPTAVNAGLGGQPDEPSGLLRPALLMLLGVMLTSLAFLTSKTGRRPTRKQL
ncbi:MAG: hypothetical protein ABWY81_01235 [Jiangellaceae bacterium]